SIRSRRLRAALSMLGIAIGIAAIVGILSVTRSSESNLLAEIDRLGTNLLTVVNGSSIEGTEAQLPTQATPMIRRVEGVQQVAPTAELADENVFRSDKIPAYETGGLAVPVAGPSLLPTLGAPLRARTFPHAATPPYPPPGP